MSTTRSAQHSPSIVERIYREVGAMASSFRFKPRERINEGELARRFGASRTPVREALNRLVAEGLLTFEAGKGFFCRELSPQEIVDLYEVRVALECEAARLAAARGRAAEIEALGDFLDRTGPDDGGRDGVELVELDEEFHRSLVAISGNRALAEQLESVNRRIRFIRWIAMEERRIATQGEHRAIVEALRKGDGAAAAEIMRGHIQKRREVIIAAVREAYSRIFLGPPE